MISLRKIRFIRQTSLHLNGFHLELNFDKTQIEIIRDPEISLNSSGISVKFQSGCKALL